MEERGASLIVLSWRGPSFPVDYVFRNDIDRVGARSPVPTLAARVLRPWQRVVVATGSIGVPWQRADSELALSCADRLRLDPSMPLIVAARSRQDADELDHIPTDAELIMTGGDDRALLDRLDDQDLLIAPVHVLRNRSPLAERRITRRLQNMNVVLVGGPHRLVFSTGASRPKPIAAPMGSSAIR